MKRILTAVVMMAGMAGLTTTVASAQNVYQREYNQQGRIAQGVRSGALTPWETAHLERQEAGVRHEIARDRFYNGGYLAAGERARVQYQENHLSREIYRDKHNGYRGY
jgi:Ni/Co efflux regulator RcnB